MISETLFSKYIKEREGFEVIETEECFVIYKIKGELAFISNAFTSKNYRRGHYMSELLDALSELLLSKKVKSLTASIDLRDQSASTTLLASLKYGFEVKAAEQGIIFIEKNLKRGVE